jgi:(+)-trans-carveol dehydrogenase
MDTVAQVEALGRRIFAAQADVRDFDSLKASLDTGVAQLGRLDIVCANAGIFSFGPGHILEEKTWSDVIDVNLTGVWNTCKATIPHLLEGGRGGAIILTSSVAGLRGTVNAAHYTAAKHGVVGLMRTLANELAPHMIRVNTINPTSVDTPMIHNNATYGLFRPDLDTPSLSDAKEGFMSINALPVPWVESIDVSNALLFLASDEARYITGVTLPVDAGQMVK